MLCHPDLDSLMLLLPPSKDLLTLLPDAETYSLVAGAGAGAYVLPVFVLFLVLTENNVW